MTYLKPYGTLNIYSVILHKEQQAQLSKLNLIKKDQTKVHINQLTRRYWAGYIEYITDRQVFYMQSIAESIGYRFKDGACCMTSIGNGKYSYNR